jgi:hypothetical protein
VYQHIESKCVDQSSIIECHSDSPIAEKHPVCKKEQENELIKFRDCDREYGICSSGTLYRAECPRESDVFSEFYNGCIETNDDPECDFAKSDRSERKIGLMKIELLSSMCTRESTQDDTEYAMYFGPCNKRYLLCGRDGYSFVGECPDKATVIDQGGVCVSISDSQECPSNSGDANFVQIMNHILKFTKYCKNKSNGIHSDPFGECRRESIFCFQDEGTFHLCPIGQGSDSRGRCIEKNSCPQTDDRNLENEKKEEYRSNFLTIFGSEIEMCQAQETEGTHTFGHCQSFFGHCHLGQFEIRNCPYPNEIFDQDLSQCRFPILEDHCPDHRDGDHVILPEPINRCSDPNQASKLLATGPCNQVFLVCVNGWDVAFKCEREDEAFNEEMALCVSKIDQSHCPEFVEKIVEEIPIEKPKTCEGDGGFHIHESDCAKFYRCAHGRLVEMNCGDGTYFDESINVCNHKHAVARCN